MLYLSDLITAIRAKIAANTYLNGELGNLVTFGIIPQQSGSVQTTYPYCCIYTIGDGDAFGSFGGTIMDDVLLQFSVWATTLSDASDIISEIGVLFNNASLAVVDNSLVSMRRASSVRMVADGQNKSQQFVYQATVSFEVTVGGC